MAMFTLAVQHAHRGLTWGIVLLAVGALHLVFRRFYARRWQAVHDARQDTAPGVTKGLYRRHRPQFYLTTEIAFGVFCIILGAILVLANA
jgi:hypothetical protein